MSKTPLSKYDEDASLLVATRHKVKKPRRYSVILHNDDYTTMEFVVVVLTRFFGKSEDEATSIMLMVHTQGRGLAGVFVRDVAESKVDLVRDFARANGHPLRCTAEPLERAEKEDDDAGARE
jgi:ATP-dependent Clp protease adaptor protein ClpS